MPSKCNKYTVKLKNFKYIYIMEQLIRFPTQIYK